MIRTLGPQDQAVTRTDWVFFVLMQHLHSAPSSCPHSASTGVSSFPGKDKGTRTAKATMLNFSPEACQQSFSGNRVRMELETVINFPSEQSIKLSQPRSGPYCRCKGHNYIVKKSSCPGWLKPPLKVTGDWQAVYGWHALTGRGVG